jgi:hypothetical protein
LQTFIIMGELIMNARSRTWRATLILLVALLTANVFYARPAQANPGPDVDINIFFGALAPYGNWVDHGHYGRVWYPRGVSRGWRPYTDGHWSYNNRYGWIWVSDWVWGWAPFHYGRWVWDDWYGWIWIPGRVWAPAWVFWRYGGGYAAWAPMPPTVIWQPGYGMVTRHFDYDRDLRREWWVGVPEHRLHHRHIRRYLVDPRRNDRFLNVTKRFADVSAEKDVIVNRGIPVELLEKNTGKRIRPIPVREVERMEDRNRVRSRGELTVVRPKIRAANSEEIRRDEELAIKARKQNEERQRVRPGADGKRSEKPEIRLPGRLQQGAPAGRERAAEPGIPPPASQDRQGRQRPEAEQRGAGRRQQQQQMEEQRLQKEQTERAREEAQRQRQLQERQEQVRQQQLQQQRQMEMQRREAEQAGRARGEAQRQRQLQERQEQARQQQLQQQRQMEIQRRQAEQSERARGEAARQRQLQEQQERARNQQMQRQQEQQWQLQRQQEMRQQQMEIQRQQSKQPQHRQQDGAESGSKRQQPPRQENRYGNRPDGR